MLINQEITNNHSHNLILRAGSILLQPGNIELTAFSP